MPADFGDEAQEASERHLNDALRKRRAQTLSIPFSGSCLHCKEPVVERRFCDSTCREDWEKALKRKACG